jgi:glycosyltransferase involved in cell wall biosynthesis
MLHPGDQQRDVAAATWVASHWDGSFDDAAGLLRVVGAPSPDADSPVATVLVARPPDGLPVARLLGECLGGDPAHGVAFLVVIAPEGCSATGPFLRAVAALPEHAGVRAGMLAGDWFALHLDTSGCREALGPLLREAAFGVERLFADHGDLTHRLETATASLASATRQQARSLDDRDGLHAEIDALKGQRRRLKDAARELRFQRDLAQWQLRSLRSRRWWRLGEVVFSLRDRPFRLRAARAAFTESPGPGERPRRPDARLDSPAADLPASQPREGDEAGGTPPEVVDQVVEPGRRKLDSASFRVAADLIDRAESPRALEETVRRNARDRHEKTRQNLLRHGCGVAEQRGWLDLRASLAKEVAELSDSVADRAEHLTALYEAMRLHDAEHVARQLPPPSELPAQAQKAAVAVGGYSALLGELAWADPAAQRSDGRVSGRVVSFLHNSLPYSNGGYATRAHGLLTALRGTGIDVRAYTRPGYPMDLVKNFKGINLLTEDVIDDLPYRRIFDGATRRMPEASYMQATADAFTRVLDEEEPELVHGRSTYVVSMPALMAARRRGVPFVYEVSGLWEVVHASRDDANARAAQIRRIKYLETVVACQADHVFTLTSAMRDELIARGVQSDNIAVAPNSVDPARFTPVSRDDRLAEAINFPPGVPVIGYIGSFQDYEGLDDLLDAVTSLRARGVAFRALLVGDGTMLKPLQREVERRDLADWVHMPGRVPFEQVRGYYSLVDIAAFPRKAWPVCEMVSPMKPFEAMALEKVIVVSSVAALREIVNDGHTGLVFDKGDVSSLTATLERAVLDSDLRADIGRKARSWIHEHRSWDRAARTVVDGYAKVLGVVPERQGEGAT